MISENCAKHLMQLCIELLERCESANIYQADYHFSNIVVNFDMTLGWSVEWCDADLMRNGRNLNNGTDIRGDLKTYFESRIYPFCFDSR